MHTVAMLNEALRVAAKLGYHVRQESLGAVSSGCCEYGGRRWIFLNLGDGPAEQFAQLVAVLQSDPRADAVRMSPPLRRRMAGDADVRRAA